MKTKKVDIEKSGMDMQFNEALNALEKFKEIERLRFDYFKQLSILSTSSIGAILAFIAKLLPTTNFRILAVLSLFCLCLCLFYSLFGMISPGNMILYLIGIRTIATSQQKTPEKREDDKLEFIAKYLKGLKEIKRTYGISLASFIIGITLFLIFAYINMTSSK